MVGGVDNVTRIQEVCHSHDVWLHVEGHNLAALALPNSPNIVRPPPPLFLPSTNLRRNSTNNSNVGETFGQYNEM